jgi:hypothetical protein
MLEKPRPYLVSLLIPILLSLAYVGQSAWFMGTQSLTFDEPAHIIAGLDAWHHRRFEQWNDQPPLARLLLTIPLLPGGDRWHIESRGPIQPSPEQFAWHTRPVISALGLVLAWLLWATARRMFSEAGANVALGLYVFSPPIIAHFSLATVDGTATLFLFATAVMLSRWISRPSWGMTIGFGAVLGGFLVSKFSAPPLALMALGLMIVLRPRGKQIRALSKAMVALGIALVIVWATYFFQLAPLTIKSGPMMGLAGGPHEAIVPLDGVDVTMRLPAASYIAGFSNVTHHAFRGQPAFLLGRAKGSGGWRLFYPVVAALKWPMLVWLTAAAFFALLAAGRIRSSAELRPMMAFPIVFLLLAVMSNLDVGDRYILPAYPFLLLASAGLFDAFKRARYAIAIASLSVAIQMADGFRYAPDYLSYFNVFVKPSRSYELLTDSNLDWGQGLIALREYQRSHPDEQISLLYFGDVDPSQYGIRAQLLGDNEHPRGTVIVSATHLSGQYLQSPTEYHWLFRYPHVAILNHTLHVFIVTTR